MKNAFSIKIGNEIINFESIDEIKNKEEYFDNTVELLFDGKKVFTGKYEDCISLLEYYKSYEEGQKGQIVLYRKEKKIYSCCFPCFYSCRRNSHVCGNL